MQLTKQQMDTILGKNEAAEEAVSVSLDEIEKFGNKDSVNGMFDDIQKYSSMLSKKITFINDELTRVVPFTRENLYLICAFSGSGKSSISANLAHPLWKQGKKILIISNEEPKHDIMFRIGALETGANFNDFKKGRMGNPDTLKVLGLFEEIGKHVKIIDVNFKNGMTTKIEGVKNALEAVEKEQYDCIMIDYLQLIAYSSDKRDKRGRFEILNEFKAYIGQYIKRSNAPVVLFAQLHSVGKRTKDIDSRIKDIPSIQEPATVIIEAIPNFEDRTTEFVIVKDRFGMQGTKVTCAFENGKFVSLTQNHIANVAAINLAKIKDQINTNSVDDDDDGDVDDVSDYRDLTGKD